MAPIIDAITVARVQIAGFFTVITSARASAMRVLLQCDATPLG